MKKAEENYGKFGLEANEVKNRLGWTTLAVRPQDFVRDFRLVVTHLAHSCSAIVASYRFV